MILTIDKATPSQNIFGKWHRMRQHKYRVDLTRMFLSQICQSASVGVPLWTPKKPRLKKGEPALCASHGCLGAVGKADPRGCHWCMAHRLRVLQPERRIVTIRRYSSGKLDRINMAGGCKSVLDALAHTGLIYDDTEEWIDDHYEQHPAKSGDSRTEIEVTDG